MKIREEDIHDEHTIGKEMVWLVFVTVVEELQRCTNQPLSLIDLCISRQLSEWNKITSKINTVYSNYTTYSIFVTNLYYFKMKPPSRLNRDISRQNKATSVVKATMYAFCSRDSIFAIQNHLENLSVSLQKLDTFPQYVTTLSTIVKLLDIALDTNNQSSRLYMKCSTYIKLGAESIAHNENGVLKRAVRFSEYDDLDSEMDHYDTSLLEMYKIINYHNLTPPPKTSTDHTKSSLSSTSSVSTMNSSTNTPSDELHSLVTSPIHQNHNPSSTLPNDTPISQLKSPHTTAKTPDNNQVLHIPSFLDTDDFILPQPKSHPTQYSPVESLNIIIKLADNKTRNIIDLPPHANNGFFQKRRVSERLIIKLMIIKNLVPVKMSTMYSLLNEYRMKNKLKYIRWRTKYKKGPKPQLERQSYSGMVSEYNDTNVGGLAASRDHLETSINTCIKRDVSEKNIIQQRKDNLPTTSISRICNRVMARKNFNIHAKVSNKTESRATAEYSVRSTISYMLVVVTQHFINAKPSKFHSKHANVKKSPLYILLNELNKQSLGVKFDEKELEELTYVLPHLITSTDEFSLFITNQIVNNKVSWYFTARPSSKLKPTVASDRRDCFTTDLNGDAHLRGLRITLNNTFTAGGLCAPIFACVFGLKMTEMPRDEIIICEVKGLVPASNVNGSMEVGYIIFIRGRYEPTIEPPNESESTHTDPSLNHFSQSYNTSTSTVSTENYDDVTITSTNHSDQQPSEDSTKDSSLSKESRVAKIYRTNVYHPFIQRIRKNHYDMESDNNEIPDNLTAVSWMDGCHGQLKLITTEDILKKEKELKIVSCKHSAARTAVEQAADVGPMFKVVKSCVKKMHTSDSENSPIFFRISTLLNDLEDTTDASNGRVVLLPKHKKDAITVGLSKLPIAMASAFTSSNIQSAFRDNGMIDESNQVIPNVEHMLGTYRGCIGKSHYLNRGMDIIPQFYNETYMNGRIDETSFDNLNIDEDKDSMGNPVSRDFEISKENCQRAKVLSSDIQRKERIKLKETIQKKEKQKRIALAIEESKKYSLNNECEKRVLSTFNEIIKQENTTNNNIIDSKNSLTFADIEPLITSVHFGRHNYKNLSKSKPNCDHLKAFIQVRKQITKHKNGSPIYYSLHNNKKEQLIDICVDMKSVLVRPRLYNDVSVPNTNTSCKQTINTQVNE
jgi:hypothetical protein